MNRAFKSTASTMSLPGDKVVNYRANRAESGNTVTRGEHFNRKLVSNEAPKTLVDELYGGMTWKPAKKPRMNAY